MPTFFDTHAHYNLPTFDGDRDKALANARAAGVEKVICPAISFESNAQMMECLADYDNIYFAVGIHPKYVQPIKKDKRRKRSVPRLSELRLEYESRAYALEELDERLASIAE